MPRKKHDTGRPPSAARQFTDREDFLAAFDYALTSLAPDRHAVLAFYGVGGIGKSRLIRRLRGEHPDPAQVPDGVPHAKINFKDPANRLPGKALERARAQFHRQGVRFPTFDVAFAVWWKMAHPNSPLKTSELKFLDEGEVASDVVSALADVPVVGLVAKIPRILDKSSRAVREWWTKRGQAELAHIAALDDKDEVLEWLPVFFGNDLKAWLAEDAGRRAVLFFDTHEALWEGRGPGESGASPDAWVRDWAAHLEGVLVVVGSRNKLRWTDDDPTWVGLIDHHLIGDLSPEDADAFLREAGVSEADVRAAIVEKSQGVPQYLDLAVDTYEQIHAAEAHPPRPDAFDANLGKLLARFLSYVRDARRQALYVLSVPETFDLDRFKDLMTTFSAGVTATRKGLKTITRFSFVDEPEPGRFVLHALVREALADQDDPDERRAVHRHIFDRADEILRKVDLLSITDIQRQALRDGVIHGQVVQPPEEWLRWFWQADKLFEQTADWRTRLPLLRAVAAFAERTLGPDHPDTLTSIHNLGVQLSDRGDYAAAEPLFHRALDGRERTLGPDHPDTLQSLHSTMALRYGQGDYGTAEALCRRALGGRERTLGPDHPDTLKSINALAALLHSRGDYAAAEPLFRRALDAREHTLGPDHPDTLQSLNNLGVQLSNRGDYDAAVLLFRRALDGRERTLGPDHPDTLQSLNDLAVQLSNRSDYDAAVPLFRRALDARERTLGPDHPNTLQSLNNLSLLHDDRGDYAAAEALCRRALDARERTLGPDHPDTLTSLGSLAVLHHNRGDYAAAEPLYRRALDGRERTFGPDHPDTLRSVSNLALLYDDRGDYAAAEPLYRRALDGRERTLGPDHPDTLTSIHNLAALLRHSQDDYAAAEALHRRALDGRERTLGPDHLDTLQSLNNLALLCDGRGDYAAAETLYRRALERSRIKLGHEHRYTRVLERNLERNLERSQGRDDSE